MGLFNLNSVLRYIVHKMTKAKKKKKWQKLLKIKQNNNEEKILKGWTWGGACLAYSFMISFKNKQWCNFILQCFKDECL